MGGWLVGLQEFSNITVKRGRMEGFRLDDGYLYALFHNLPR